MELKGENITFSYDGKKNILENININARSGERLGICGVSGCGKSTLAKVLAGYVKPLSGNVFIDGKTPEDRGYSPIQLIFQHPEKAVNPKFTMDKVLEESGGVDDNILEALAIEKSWLTRVSCQLSTGELQRFCVARALNKNTKFIIADEITTMLDVITQANLWKFLIEETEKMGIGLIIISHDKPLLEKICDRKFEM